MLRTGNFAVATVMRRLSTGHALWYNRRHRRSGHLFQNGGLIRSHGGWVNVKAMRRAKIFEKANERILGDGDVIQKVLAAAEEKMKRRYLLQANVVNFESLARRVAEIFDIPFSELWIQGKHRWRVRVKSVLCYWANRELEVSMSESSHRMNVSVMTMSHAVQRGEKIAKEFGISFY